MKNLEIKFAQYAIKNNEFPEEIISSNDNVAIILTQSWCPQWFALKHYISKINLKNLDVYVFVYDNSPIFAQFMNFKEQIFNNFEIPYIRYYKRGKFMGDSNYINKTKFLKKVSFEKISPLACSI